jgi:hypothetical protein
MKETFAPVLEIMSAEIKTSDWKELTSYGHRKNLEGANISQY